MPLLRILSRGNIRFHGWFWSCKPRDKIAYFQDCTTPGLHGWNSSTRPPHRRVDRPRTAVSVRRGLTRGLTTGCITLTYYIVYYTDHHIFKPLFKILSRGKIRFWILGWADCRSLLASIYWQFTTAMTSVSIPNISIFEFLNFEFEKKQFYNVKFIQRII